RLELNGERIRVIEVAPGMVHTEEFSLVRLGDQAAADKVYDGVDKPLTADDCADVIAYALNAPHHVNLDLVTVRPLAQAAAHQAARTRAAKAYDAFGKPLTADACAAVIAYALTAHHHVNLDLATVRPLAQAPAHKVARHRGV